MIVTYWTSGNLLAQGGLGFKWGLIVVHVKLDVRVWNHTMGPSGPLCLEEWAYTFDDPLSATQLQRALQSFHGGKDAAACLLGST